MSLIDRLKGKEFLVSSVLPLTRCHMTIVVKLALITSLFLLGVLVLYSGWGPFIWFQGTRLLPEGVGFGYYGDFHAVSRAIEQSPCAESIEYSRHEDITLEDFHF